MTNATVFLADPDSGAPELLAVIQSAVGSARPISLGCEQRVLAILQRAEKEVLRELFADACSRHADLAIELVKVKSRG